MSNPRREQTNQLPAAQLPNPSSYPWLCAGALAEITVRAACTTADIPERISSLKTALAATQMPPDVRRHIDEAIFDAQGSISHSKKFTSAAAKTPWQTFAKQHQSGQKATIDSRLRNAERNHDATPRGRNPRQPGDSRHTPTEPHRSGIRRGRVR